MKKGYDSLGRPCKDLYFMNMCMDATLRSFDSTKHGCVAVSKEGRILSSGYNGPISGSIDENIPMTRPDKYDFMEHAERNCINSAARYGNALDGCIFYVSGLPCLPCLRGMYGAGASEVVFGPITSHMLSTKEHFKHYDLLLQAHGGYRKIRMFDYVDELIEINPKVKDVLEGCPEVDIRKYFKAII